MIVLFTAAHEQKKSRENQAVLKSQLWAMEVFGNEQYAVDIAGLCAVVSSLSLFLPLSFQGEGE